MTTTMTLKRVTNNFLVLCTACQVGYHAPTVVLPEAMLLSLINLLRQ